MNDTNIQSLMSFLCPHEDEGVPMFIGCVAKALGSAKDRTVALTIGVSSATIANWKRRNRIPDDYQVWLNTTLIKKIVGYNRQYPKTELEARIALLRLLKETDGDPYKLGIKGEVAVANSMPGLLALSQFLLDRMYVTCRDESEVTVERLCDLLKTAMFFARRADHIRAFH
ncbi:helix-turn-helix domain-containing protein [Sphingorhabdus sp. EL138]|uniref:helix-turn-helix domain-containing protein n=1 Tax=Sphingorhabdus sp. EL138 TaxID=2073156 RepID=UPI000D68D81F|nr:helix-turn-helix domain-containing protein [Sphingorhabdus sp. EL138]